MKMLKAWILTVLLLVCCVSVPRILKTFSTFCSLSCDKVHFQESLFCLPSGLVRGFLSCYPQHCCSVTKAGAWPTDFCVEESSPWIGNCIDVLSSGCPWKAFVGDVLPDGSRHRIQADSGEWGICPVLLFTTTVSASQCRNRTEDGPERAAFSCSMHTKLNCCLWFQLSFFMTPTDKDKVHCQIRGILQCLFQSCKCLKMLWDTYLMKSQLQ